MLTRVYMKWALLVISGAGISAELVVAFAVTVALSNRQDKLQVLWWRLGHGSTKAIYIYILYIYIIIYILRLLYIQYIYIIRIYDWLYSELLGLCSGYDVSIPGTSHHSGFAQWHRVKRSRICPSSLEADTSDLWKKMGDFAHPKWLFAWGK